MSQQAVERTLGKLLTDESFRERFLTAPREAAVQAGLQLSDIELAALSGLSRSALCSFSASLDPRVCRLCPESGCSPEEGRLWAMATAPWCRLAFRNLRSGSTPWGSRTPRERRGGRCLGNGGANDVRSGEGD